MKILAVDDDPELLPLVAFTLRQGGFYVLEASTGARAIEIVADQQPDLIVLDVNLPDIDGFEVCRRLRSEGNATAVLLLTVRDSEEDQVRGLDIGADDYLTKPFSPRTLLARVRALLRRARIDAPSRIAHGEVELDEEARTVRIAGRAAQRLTPLEFRLLHFLAVHGGRPVHTERILLHVWGTDSAGDRQLLKQLVRRTRQKIEDDPSHPTRLVTEAGIGYRLAT
jgi:DNA-binding response OmpR family regulator